LPRLASEGLFLFFSGRLYFHGASSLLRRLAWPKRNKPERSESMPTDENNNKEGINQGLDPSRCLASAHRRRGALSFWHQKETKNAG